MLSLDEQSLQNAFICPFFLPWDSETRNSLSNYNAFISLKGPQKQNLCRFFLAKWALHGLGLNVSGCGWANLLAYIGKICTEQTFGLHFKMVLTSSFMPYSRQSAPCSIQMEIQDSEQPSTNILIRVDLLWPFGLKLACLWVRIDHPNKPKNYASWY